MHICMYYIYINVYKLKLKPQIISIVELVSVMFLFSLTTDAT